MCHSGWKGSECDVPTNQCIDVTCSGHGTCIVGTCICNPGYKGENCEEGKSVLMIGVICVCPFVVNISSFLLPWAVNLRTVLKRDFSTKFLSKV